MALSDVIEQAGGIEDLESRLEPEQEAGSGNGDFDGAERHPFDRRRDLAELIGRVHLDLDACPGSFLDTRLESLHPLMREIVHRGRRYLHRELLR